MKAARALLAVSLVALQIACGPAYGEAFLTPYRAAQRAYGAGRYAEAAELYDQAARDAVRVKDRDEALIMKALMHERLEDHEAARASY